MSRLTKLIKKTDDSNKFTKKNMKNKMHVFFRDLARYNPQNKLRLARNTLLKN